MFEERVKAGLTVGPYVIHCGAVGGFNYKVSKAYKSGSTPLWESR